MTEDEAVTSAIAFVERKYAVSLPVALVGRLDCTIMSWSGSLKAATRGGDVQTADRNSVRQWMVFFHCSWESDAQGIPQSLVVLVNDADGVATFPESHEKEHLMAMFFGSQGADKGFHMPPGSFAPDMIDLQIRQAISLCWMMLPPENRNVQTVKATVKRIVDRALHNLDEDAQLFGFADEAE